MAETANLEKRSLLKIIRLLAGVIGFLGFYYATSLLYDHKPAWQAGAVVTAVLVFWYKIESWIRSL
jgi:hypothetical protein